MANVWFWSDLHYGHRLVAGHRGFGEDIGAHDAALDDAMRAVLRKGDQLWLLGDLALAQFDDALARLGAISSGNHVALHLILGNHDKPHPLNRQSHKFQRRYLDVFASVQTMAHRKVAGKTVMLSHFPYHGDHVERPHLDQYRLRDKGRWLLHGHTHSTVRYDGGRQIHVGVDAWREGPVPLDQIETIINKHGE